MSEHNAKTIKEAITEMLKSYHLDDGIREAKAKDAWNQSMGKIILKHTVELKLKNRVLHVRLNSSVVRHELIMAKTDLMRQMNEAMGEEWIQDIYFC